MLYTKSSLLINIIRIYIYKYFLRKYGRLIAYTSDRHYPRPHKFCNIGLKSGGWDKNTIQELLAERKKLLEVHGQNLKQYREAKDELESVIRAKNLDLQLPDKSKNWDMNKIMSFYESFFDEDSGNTREEGINQLQDFLKGEVNLYKNNCSKIMKDIDDIRIEFLKKKDAELLKKQKDAETMKSSEDTKISVEENKKAVPLFEESKKPVPLFEESKKTTEESKKLVPLFEESKKPAPLFEESKNPTEESKKTTEESKKTTEESKKNNWRK